MKEYTANAIMYICVASVFITWAITGHLEDIKELQNEKEIKTEMVRNGYVQCVENNFINASFAKIVWKKECESTVEILKNRH